MRLIESIDGGPMAYKIDETIDATLVNKSRGIDAALTVDVNIIIITDNVDPRYHECATLSTSKKGKLRKLLKKN